MSGKTELLLFDDLAPQVVVENGIFVNVPPAHSIAESGTTISFHIHGSEGDYLDLNDSLLYVKFQVLTSDKKQLAATATLAAVNYTLNALFSDITVYLNDTIIEGGAQLYPYKSTIENIFGFNRQTRKLQLAPMGYDADRDNRKAWIARSADKELVGALRIDFFNQPKYLLPNVDVRVVLTKSKAKFALCGGGGGNPRLVISEAKLYIRRVRVNTSVSTAHELSLEKKNAIYPYTRGQVISYSIAAGSLSHFRDNVFSSSLLPKFVIVGFVKASAFNGDNVDDEPFHFQHFNVSSIALYRDGLSLPYREPYEPDFAHDLFTKDYMKSIIHNPQHLNTNLNNGISLKDFKDMYTLFTFNLTPDFDMTQCQMPKDGNLRLEVKFAQPLPNAINVLVYGTFDTQIEITKDRKVVCSHVH